MTEFFPCKNCLHNSGSREDVVKHTNVLDGHRFFTKYCQLCKCDKAEKLEVVMVTKSDVETKTVLIFEMFKRGMGKEMISKYFNCSVRNVNQHLKRYRELKQLD